MSASNAPKLSLKVAINKQKSKVLFAEAGGDFVDVLLSFLTLPLGKIIYILQAYYGYWSFLGSIAPLNRSIWNLDGSHYCVDDAKKILQRPRSWCEAEWRELKLDITFTQQKKYFVCRECSRSRHESSYISLYSDVVQCNICGMLLKDEICLGESSDRAVFMKKESSFIITDDLRVVPVVTGFLQTINTLGITDADDADLSSLSFEMADIVELLKLSLTSSSPLSDLIIKSKARSWASPSLFHPPVLEKNVEAPNSRKMIIHATLQKSTNKFLFAQVRDDFVEFLLSFLTSSLGRVEHLLSGKTSLHNIDNIYLSVKDSIGSDYFMSSDIRNRLINPELAKGYVSENQILPLGEDMPPPRLYHPEMCKNFTCREGPSRYVKKKTMYIVNDDLSIKPYSISSSMSVLNDLGIPLSDVRETELYIGRQEALCILKASLISGTAMSDALMLKKVPKQEP